MLKRWLNHWLGKGQLPMGTRKTAPKTDSTRNKETKKAALKPKSESTKAHASHQKKAKPSSSSPSSIHTAHKTTKNSHSNGANGKKGPTIGNSVSNHSTASHSNPHSSDGAHTALLSKSLLDSPLLNTSETVCREVACEGLATTASYCRLHYIKNWKKIKRKEIILREGKLNQYIEELVVKYPDKYIEAIRQDLASDKDFSKIIYDLDLDEGIEDFDTEGAEGEDSIIDTIKREYEDEGDAF